MNRTVVYIRVSTRQQSQESQSYAIGKWVKESKITADYITDTATGKNQNRPGIQELWTRIRTGTVDRIVVWKISRLGRNVREVLELLQTCQDRSVTVVSLTEPIQMDNAFGRALVTLLALLDDLQREILVENTHAGLAVAKSKGTKLGGSRIEGIQWVTQRTYDKIPAILTLAKDGLTPKQIAKGLDISLNRVMKVMNTPRHLLITKKEAERQAKMKSGLAR